MSERFHLRCEAALIHYRTTTATTSLWFVGAALAYVLQYGGHGVV